MRVRRPRLLLALVAFVALAAIASVTAPVATAAVRSDDRGEVRVRAACSGSSELNLRLRARDGSIRMELRIEQRRRGPWSVIVLRERRTVFRGILRPTSTSRDVRLRRTVRDLFGANAFVVRATGPRREVCRVSATV